MLEGRSWRDADGENPGATDTRLRAYSGKMGVVGSTPFLAELLRTYHS